MGNGVVLDESKKTKQKIKCVVWDLDNTIWDGIILEDNDVSLRDGILDIIRVLDERGILQSVASKNDFKTAMDKLDEFGISEYFLYPQINWNAKSASIKTIAQLFNIGIDSIAFIDDQIFELEEVKSVNSEVLCINAVQLDNLLEMPEVNPRFITEDSKIRRRMYMADIERNRVEEGFSGPQDEFLATLNMIFTISPVTEDDLQRAEELTVRTHQLNTTGYTYSYSELDALRKSDNHKLLIASLEDKYGTYGKIGLILIEYQEDKWVLKLLLMSCRVMSRGVGSILINYLMKIAKENNVQLLAEFVKTERNKMMYITYKFAGFTELEENGDHILLKNDFSRIQEFPDYVELRVTDSNTYLQSRN